MCLANQYTGREIIDISTYHIHTLTCVHQRRDYMVCKTEIEEFESFWYSRVTLEFESLWYLRVMYTSIIEYISKILHTLCVWHLVELHIIL